MQKTEAELKHRDSPQMLLDENCHKSYIRENLVQLLCLDCDSMFAPSLG